MLPSWTKRVSRRLKAHAQRRKARARCIHMIQIKPNTYTHTHTCTLAQAIVYKPSSQFCSMCTHAHARKHDSDISSSLYLFDNFVLRHRHEHQTYNFWRNCKQSDDNLLHLDDHCSGLALIEGRLTPGTQKQSIHKE